ncbi:MAG TPA: tetratricopeptide repeat protein [Longimicrobium sp.]|nr:tetratricopeptide repeat protein [Longimicrobium sp.]
MKAPLAALLAALCAAAPAPAQTLDEALDLFYRDEIQASLPVFQALVDARPADPDLRAWLAEALRRTGDEARALELARRVLADAPCHAPAHTLAATIFGLQYWEPGAKDSARAHATRAVECAPDDGNAWVTYWVTAMLRRDGAGEAAAQRRIAELAFIPEPAMEMGRWVLRSSPPDAVLLANGDWDYFPMMVAQTVEGVRPDVTIVLVSTLELPWYVRRMAARTGYAPPGTLKHLGDEEGLANDAGEAILGSLTLAAWAGEWLENRNPRPLVLAATVPPELVANVAWPRWDGPVYTLRPPEEAPSDTLRRIDADAFAQLLPHLDLARLDGPLTHATDRSPIRRTGVHPAEYVVWQLFSYGNARVLQERRDEARRAMAMIDALVATGHVGEEYHETVELLRTILEP